MTQLPIDDVVFIKQIKDPFSDGPELLIRLRQSEGRRFVVHDDGGLLKITGGRVPVWVGKSNVAYIVPMTPERAKALGPNPLEKQEKAK